MGARQYLPCLGRYIEVDPVEGGNANDCPYVIDTINGSDLDGTWCLFGHNKNVSCRGSGVIRKAAWRAEKIGDGQFQ